MVSKQKSIQKLVMQTPHRNPNDSTTVTVYPIRVTTLQRRHLAQTLLIKMKNPNALTKRERGKRIKPKEKD